MGYLVPEGFRYGSLRALRDSDVDGMLEWMHDPQIAGVFEQDFMSVTREGALAFVGSTHQPSGSLHFAIAGEDDVYLGTVSLKDVDEGEGTAEYAIATRASSHGTGAAMRATRDVLAYAFGELGLSEVYLCVRPDNCRARAFYGKVGFVPCETRASAADPTLLWLHALRDGAGRGWSS